MTVGYCLQPFNSENERREREREREKKEMGYP